MTNPQPLTIAKWGSSATLTGTRVFSLRTWSKPLSWEPPPARTIPLSIMSEESSAGVASKASLITSKMEIIPTGLKFPKIDGEWLLDGEYITKDKNGADLDNNLYMIFDIN